MKCLFIDAIQSGCLYALLFIFFLEIDCSLCAVSLTDILSDSICSVQLDDFFVKNRLAVNFPWSREESSFRCSAEYTQVYRVYPLTLQFALSITTSKSPLILFVANQLFQETVY